MSLALYNCHYTKSRINVKFYNYLKDLLMSKNFMDEKIREAIDELFARFDQDKDDRLSTV